MNKGKKTQKLEQPVITEEDRQTTDPFLRALAKKIRNLNKKIADIETLEKREDLKPEQQDKINSKPSIIDQRKKYQDFVKFYKSTLAQANKDEANNQLAPVLTKLSNALVTAHYLRTGGALGNVQFAANEKKILLNIGNIGQQEDTLKNLTTNLSGYLGEYLDNQKLLAKVEEAYTNEALLNTRVTLVSVTQQEKPATNTVKETPKKEHKTPKQTKQVQQTKQITQQVKQTVVTEPADTAPVQPTTQATTQPTKQETKVQESWIDETPTVQNPPAAATQQNTQNVANQTETKPQEEKRPQKNERYQKKPYDPNRSNYRQGGNRDGGYREGGYREGGNNREGGNRQGGYKNYRGGERKQYRPKYQEKQQDQDNRSDTSLEDSAEKDTRRNFNNRQINDLQNEGFVVVQRKPKAKDTHESQEYSRKQHGYKDKRPHVN